MDVFCMHCYKAVAAAPGTYCPTCHTDTLGGPCFGTGRPGSTTWPGGGKPPCETGFDVIFDVVALEAPGGGRRAVAAALLEDVVSCLGTVAALRARLGERMTAAELSALERACSLRSSLGGLDRADAQPSEASVAEAAPAPGTTIRFRYTNHRGETEDREVTPIRIRFGTSEHHREPSWLMDAYDHNRRAVRSFLVSGMLG